MSKLRVLLLAWLPDGVQEQLTQEFPQCQFQRAGDSDDRDRLLKEADITYGLPPIAQVGNCSRLRWIQLTAAGVPQELCPPAQANRISVTNLAGLYGPGIAAHALAFMIVLSRKLHVAFRQQAERRWDRSIGAGMVDIHGKTLAVIGLGNIGQNIARLAKAHGMQVLGCRRTGKPAPYVDLLYPLTELRTMLAQADYVAMAVPLIPSTEGMLGHAEFQAMKPGATFINICRGQVAQEPALLDALRSGKLAGAGLDVFGVEPLAADHPLWSMPNVVISPHVCGETINLSHHPSRRFARNLHNFLAEKPMEGIVDLAWGY